jgi:hypothetical protein
VDRIPCLSASGRQKRHWIRNSISVAIYYDGQVHFSHAFNTLSTDRTTVGVDMLLALVTNEMTAMKDDSIDLVGETYVAESVVPHLLVFSCSKENIQLTRTEAHPFMRFYAVQTMMILESVTDLPRLLTFEGAAVGEISNVGIWRITGLSINLRFLVIYKLLEGNDANRYEIRINRR